MRVRFAAVPVWVGVLAVSLGTATAADTLVEAVKAGDRDAAFVMIADGADVNESEPNGTTALHWAVYREDVDLVERLIERGANPSTVNGFGSSPMMEAAVNGNAAIVGLLLEAGADPDSANPENQTALMAAARTGNVDAAKLLLDAGAGVNRREDWGHQSALMWAASQKQPEMVKLLVEHGADVDARGVDRNWQRRVTAEPRPKDLDRGGFTPLLYAARDGCLECARYLVEGGADIDLHDPDRTSPLVLALMNMRFDLARYLIVAGADLDKWDLYGQSPVYAAVDLGTLPRGGRPDIPSADETSAIEVLEMLLDRGANPNIQLKMRPPYRNVIFDRGGDGLLSTGATPLLRASKAGDNPDAIRRLLEYGALVDLPAANGTTPLMAAAGMGHGNNPTRGRLNTEDDALAAIPILLAGGAEVNAQAVNGQTAVHAAVEKSWGRVIRLLAESGADLELADRGGRTPMDHAMGVGGRGFGGRGGRGGPAPANREMVRLLSELIR